MNNERQLFKSMDSVWLIAKHAQWVSCPTVWGGLATLKVLSLEYSKSHVNKHIWTSWKLKSLCVILCFNT